jgi:hypothetical protein
VNKSERGSPRAGRGVREEELERLDNVDGKESYTSTEAMNVDKNASRNTHKIDSNKDKDMNKTSNKDKKDIFETSSKGEEGHHGQGVGYEKLYVEEEEGDNMPMQVYVYVFTVYKYTNVYIYMLLP